MAGEAEFNLVELFWSAQGEGPLVGRSMLFLRFGQFRAKMGDHAVVTGQYAVLATDL